MLWPFPKKKEKDPLIGVVVDSINFHPDDWEWGSYTFVSAFGFERRGHALSHKLHKAYVVVDETPSTYGGWKLSHATLKTSRRDSELLSSAVLNWRKNTWRRNLLKQAEQDALLKDALKELEETLK